MHPTEEINAALRRRFLADEAEMKPGIYHGLGNDAYHGGDGVSRSILSCVEDESPYDTFMIHLDPERPREQEEVRPGTLSHCAIFEPDEFANRYAVIPEDVKKPSVTQLNAAKPSADTIIQIQKWESFCASIGLREIIKPEQYEACMRQADAVRAHPEAMQLLGTGRPEVSAYWRDISTGLLCRVRPDWCTEFSNGMVALPDGKTFATANPNAFRRQAEKMDYHVQAAYYSDGWEQATGQGVAAFPFIVVRDTYPWTISVVYLDEETLAAGREKYRRCLDAFARCLKAGNWPGFPEGIKVGFSKWKLNADTD